MTASLDFAPELPAGISTYQDLVVGQTVVQRGVRDCDARWRLIAPYVGHRGPVIDIGSNFGWFGLTICRERPRVVVASVEADLRSAAVQRRMLAANDATRVALLTAHACERMLVRFQRAGQRFETALCLAVLHWLPDHERFLARLATIADTVIVEFAHPDERGAGLAQTQREIGEPRTYLRRVVPLAQCELAGHAPNHRRPRLPREVWIVRRSNESNRPHRPLAAQPARAELSPGLDASSLFAMGLSWPPRSFWQTKLVAFASPGARHENAQVGPWLTADGLLGETNTSRATNKLKWRARGLPETELILPRERLRRVAAALRRRFDRLSPFRRTGLQ